MYLECTCTDITLRRFDELMKGAKRTSYKKLVKRIKEELPDLYNELCLNFHNPWDSQAKETQTHFILVWSAIEYFIHK